MNPKERLSDFLDRLEQLPAIGEDPQLRGFLQMAKSGLGMLRGEAALAWCELIEQAVAAWRQGEAKAA